jgi:hypothetical protein
MNLHKKSQYKLGNNADMKGQASVNVWLCH